ncbi:MAG: MauE/DoxX family redox-associated membrane protein [Planctomycetia bacterium]
MTGDKNPRPEEKDSLSRKWSVRLVAVTVGAILIRSAVRHLENSYAFLASIYSYDLVSRDIGVVMAVVLPATQLTLGLMLMFFQDMRRFALLFSAGLFGVFVTAQIVTLARGLNIDCGCFGSEMKNPIGWKSICLTAGLFIVSVVAGLQARIQPNSMVTKQ